MNSFPITKKTLLFFTFASILILTIKFALIVSDRHTKIVFCSVGQGDAIYIRIKNKFDVLIDAGPDRSILSCLGKYMPFWDRKIEMALLSHPNSDHYNGFFFVSDRYKIDKLLTIGSLVENKTYKKLIDKLSKNNTFLSSAISGDKIAIEDGKFTFYWPHARLFSPNDNDLSIVFLFESRSVIHYPSVFRVLFTGDASPFVLGRLSHMAISKVDVLKVPHHGSKNGLTKTFLDLADPGIAVISVGKNNSFGHPTKQVLDMLRAKGIETRRTDTEGSIVF